MAKAKLSIPNRRFIALSVFIFFGINVFAAKECSKADSIVTKFLQAREFYKEYIQEFDALIYIKGNSEVEKKNFLTRYASSHLYVDRRGRTGFMEGIVNLHYEAPNYSIQQISAARGSKVLFKDLQERVAPFLTVNPSAYTLFNNMLLVPDEKRIFKYYRFEYVSSTDTLGHVIHKIKFAPKMENRKLVSGYYHIIEGSWSVYKIETEGLLDFSRYKIETTFGMPGRSTFLLPEYSSLQLYTELLGNKSQNHYLASYDYLHVTRNERNEEKSLFQDYDLSNYFSIQLDTIPIVNDTTFWNLNRKLPLTPQEQAYWNSFNSTPTTKTRDTVSVQMQSLDLLEDAISPKKIKYNTTQLNYSGILNPLKFAYSKQDGLIYWQQLKFRHISKSGKDLSFTPRVGFLFREKEIYYNAPLTWDFKPSRLGQLNIEGYKRNRTYNYKIKQLLTEGMPDGYDFEDLDLDYYRHYTVKSIVNYELLNGLSMYTGFNYDWFVPVHTDDHDTNELKVMNNGEANDLIENTYRNFSPKVGLKWTPGQYYRMAGRRKIYVMSFYPTFTLEYSRGINGVMGGKSDYERLEASVEQKINIGLLNSISYYIGAGTFTNSGSFYFADFSFFQKKNLPQSWDDPIGGVFQLLNGDWYSASDSYMQVHLMYESPFIILYLFKHVHKDILKERFYISQLYTPDRKSYTEFGYGVGNYIGNIGIFSSFNKLKFESFGVKFSFEFGRN